MSDVESILKNEYSEEFDNKRKQMVAVSYFKYGPARQNFGNGYVDAIGSLKKCLNKFEETKNLEYLLDVANYAMFRYMYPAKGEYFKATDSNGSAGIEGLSINEAKTFMNNSY